MLVKIQALGPPKGRLSVKTSPKPRPTLLSTSKINPSPVMGGALTPVQLPLAPVPPQSAVVPEVFQVSSPFEALAVSVAAASRAQRRNRIWKRDNVLVVDFIMF